MTFLSNHSRGFRLVFLLGLIGAGLSTAGVSATVFALEPAETYPADSNPIRIVVSILPQAWFAEQLGGEQVAVSVLVGPGQSPATYDPSAKQMARLQQSDLFFFAGVPFEKGLLPRIARMTEGPVLAGVAVSQPAAAEESGAPDRRAVHDHGADDHGHDGLDPHTWLDPLQAQVLADTMFAALCRLRPASREVFRSRREELRETLNYLDQDVRTKLLPFRGRDFYVFHPAFGHFAAAYGLNQIAIEAGGHAPGARHLAGVIDRAREAGASAILVQPQFSRKSAAAVARSLDIEVISLDPLARDYDTNLRGIAETLSELFTGRHQPDPHRKNSP